MRTALALPVLALLLAGCSDPAAEHEGRMPGKIGESDPVIGKSLFEANCRRCHGEAGLGSQQGPPLIHRIYEPGHHADFSFHRAVSHGVRSHHWNFGDMPPVPAVSAEQAGHIIAYIRQQQRLAGIN